MVVGSAHVALLMPTVSPVVIIAIVFLGAVSFATTIAVISAGLGALRRFNETVGHRWEGAFLSLFILGMILASLSAAIWLSPLRLWQMLGPLLSVMIVCDDEGIVCWRRSKEHCG
jgi:hypothetical protein